jgi:hypothetical protein
LALRTVAAAIVRPALGGVAPPARLCGCTPTHPPPHPLRAGECRLVRILGRGGDPLSTPGARAPPLVLRVRQLVVGASGRAFARAMVPVLLMLARWLVAVRGTAVSWGRLALAFRVR